MFGLWHLAEVSIVSKLSPRSQPQLCCTHLVHLKGASRGVREAGRGAAPAGSCTQHEHSGGIGTPPGTTRSPCQELADDLGIALPAFGLLERDSLTGKRGPVAGDVRDWRAERRPRGHEP
jgi:hypothetical protein